MFNIETINRNTLENRFVEMGSFGEGIFTKSEEKNCIGLLLYKPDSITKTLDLPIMDYVKNNIEAVTKKPVSFFAYNQVQINQEMVHQLYPEESVRKFLPYIIDNFDSGPSMLILVTAKNAPEELNKLKGEVRKRTGIRGKFSSDFKVDEDVIKKWRANEFDPEKTKQMGMDLYGANLIHIPDNKNDTKKTIDIFYSKKDVSDLIKSIPLFARWYK